jgi:hypothetical protein
MPTLEQSLQAKRPWQPGQALIMNWALHFMHCSQVVMVQLG